jgi:dolichol-phosphate mannosyltransferase
MKILIVIPTYDELENINGIMDAVFSVEPRAEVLVVDDNSPDGTGDTVERRAASDKRVHLLRRTGKMGLGTAYVAGFTYAVQNGYDVVFEMDADFSHDPKEIPNFLAALADADVVVGSRYYSKETHIVNWPLRRLILSYSANIYTRIITGMPVTDATGGYNCFRINVLKAIDLQDIHSNGYSFQIEMKLRAWMKKFRIKEIPIIFVDRRSGVSKMNKKIVYEAAYMVWRLKFRALTGSLH